MTETQRRFLRRLREEQPRGMRQSDIPKSCRALIDSLQTCGAVDFRPSESGRGVVLCIVHWAAFGDYIKAHCPMGLDVDVNQIMDRATAVYMLADAKAFGESIGQGIFVRATKPGIQLFTTDGESVEVTELTTQAGGTGIQLSSNKNWLFQGTIAVVEGADAFWKHETVLPEIDLAVYASGRMSRRLLNWLSSRQMAGCRITHWGDYDPVGICEYVRLGSACVGRVSAFAPPLIEQLLPEYGKKTLITRQARFLKNLRLSDHDPHVRRMLFLFDNYRRGLEQEILLNFAV